MKSDQGAMLIYRIMRILYEKKVPIIPKLLKVVLRVVYSCTISYKTSIGEGTKLPHGGLGVVIHEDAIIGRNCKILQNVTIGGRNGKSGAPKIGDDVLVGAGAVLLGDIKIGNNVAIGANAVVLNNIPDNAVVVGVPGRIIRFLSKDESVK